MKKLYTPAPTTKNIFFEFFIIKTKESIENFKKITTLREIIFSMEHYSTNAKNRKLKKQIQGFLSRLGFAGGKLPGSGQLILLMSIFLFVSLFLPWLQITSATQGIETYSAFSRHMGFIGYGIVIGISIITFFLLSHTKKEHIRAYVPFRLSDTQAIIFVTSMLLVAVIQLLILLPAYQSFGGVHVQSGFLLA